MSVRFLANNRDEFILFGKVLARTLRAHDPDRQWIISLQGDTSSGKSLLPLAADWERNPNRYPREGITEAHFIHEMAAHHHPEHYQGIYDADEFARIGAPQPNEEKIYFNDGLSQLRFQGANYRPPWEGMLATLQDTKLIYLSNVRNWSQLRTRSNAEAGRKILIDMRIEVQVAEEEGFVRLLHFTTGDKGLDKKIKAAYDAALNPPQPGAPAPRARRRRAPRRDAE